MTLDNMAEPLLAWYAQNARDLPWRRNPEAYHVWISEIMLQQTRVEAVKRYYERFLGELPTIRDLAEVPEDRLLKLWEGLGYYNRVRNMQKAAIRIMEEGGEFPHTYEKIRELPGIGDYTAGAIASIAFGLPEPAVDGNVLRVMTRLTGCEDDILKDATKKKIAAKVRELIPKDRAGDFTQAMIELGATVCGPNEAPNCKACPLQDLCIACRDASYDKIPYRAPLKKRKIEEKTVLVLLSDTDTVIRKRPDQGLLAGLYEFPNVQGHLDMDAAAETVKGMGFSPLRVQSLPDAKHIFTHIEWHMKGYLVRIEEPEIEKAHADIVRTDGSQIGGMHPDTMQQGKEQIGKEQTYITVGKNRLLKDYSIPSAFKAYLKAYRELIR